MKRLNFLAISLFYLASAQGQRHTFTVDPGASEVRIKLNTTHEVVNGTFHVQSGTIDFGSTGTRIDGQIVVAAGSGSTGNRMRDKKMSKSILKAEQFSVVSFSPRSYTGTLADSGDSTIQVTGTFMLLGAPHDLTVPLQLHIEGARATAKGQFSIPYVEWGLKNPSFLMWKVDDEVGIAFNLVGSLTSK